jgi:hypothetical protein
MSRDVSAVINPLHHHQSVSSLVAMVLRTVVVIVMVLRIVVVIVRTDGVETVVVKSDMDVVLAELHGR